MKLTISLYLMAVIATSVLMMIVPLVSAGTVYVEGTRMDIHSDKVNKTECYQMIGKMPAYSLDEIKVIRVYQLKQSNGCLGRYLWNSHIVELYRGCDERTLVHELAHHLQYRVGLSVLDAQRHTNFSKYEQMILETGGRK